MTDVAAAGKLGLGINSADESRVSRGVVAEDEIE